MPESRDITPRRADTLKALRREGEPRRIPFEFHLCPALLREFTRRTGRADYQDYYGFPVRYLEPNPSRQKADYSAYYDALPPEAAPISWNPEWGVMGLPGSIAHFQNMLHPMERFTSIEEIRRYPWPDFDQNYRWAGLEDEVALIKADDRVVVGNIQMTLFELAWYLRGMERFMLDLLENPEFAGALLDRILEIRLAMVRQFGRIGVDVLMLGDDVSTQLDMMMRPAMWRTHFKGRMREIITEARRANPDLLVFYHGDGNLRKIIPDLIEIGIDILNPIQPECLDPEELKGLYGDRLSFWGGLGTQTVMPFGSPDDVRRTCLRLIETVGKGGGLFLAPTHMLEPDVPWRNIEAFLEVVGAD